MPLAPPWDPARAMLLLEAARARRSPLAPFTDETPALDAAWAYDVQARDRRRRTSRGERAIGAKLRLTRAAKQERMCVAEPIVRFLPDTMALRADRIGAALPRGIHPRIEPEIAFVTAAPISGELDAHGAYAAVARVAVAAEVIDSRYAGYRFRLPDVVADNTSAAGVLLGPSVPVGDAGDLSALRCTVTVDGAVRHEATGAAILGDPLAALVHLSRHLHDRGEFLPAGSLVLAGALTDAEPLVAGSSYRLAIEGLGVVGVDL